MFRYDTVVNIYLTITEMFVYRIGSYWLAAGQLTSGIDV